MSAYVLVGVGVGVGVNDGVKGGVGLNSNGSLKTASPLMKTPLNLGELGLL
jgi:hypothetical protein